MFYLYILVGRRLGGLMLSDHRGLVYKFTSFKDFTLYVGLCNIWTI